MDNFNVQAYKDGNDIILVFKNANKDLEDIVKNLLINSIGDNAITEIKGIEPLIEKQPEKPENFDEYEELMPDFLTDDIGSDLNEETIVEDIVEEAVEEKKDEPVNISAILQKGSQGFVELCLMIRDNKLSDNQEAVNAVKDRYKNVEEKKFSYNVMSNLKINDLEKVLLTFYPLCEEKITQLLLQKSYSDLNSFIQVANISTLRNICFDVADVVKNFIKEL